jgi:hypothetical protein
VPHFDLLYKSSKLARTRGYMTMQNFLNRARRWLGLSASMPPGRKARRPVMRRRALVEPLEERRVLTTNFVTALYQDVLNRAPDSGGQAYYQNLLATGTTPLAVATMFWNSPEHRGIEVDSYYQTFLKRAPDSAGRQLWIHNMVVNGMTEETVMAGFLTSNEFLQDNPPMTPYVDALYEEVLGRAADPTGVSSWLVVLESRPGTTPGPLSAVDEAYVLGAQRAVAAGSFVRSIERETAVVDSFYNDYLQRLPDTAGQQNWVAQLTAASVSDQTVAETFLSSQEFINNHPI